MNRQGIAVLALVMAALLVGCGATYRAELDQRLAGKPVEQRRSFLAAECGKEIRGGLRPDNPANVRHFDTLRKICEEMTGKKVSLQWRAL